MKLTGAIGVQKNGVSIDTKLKRAAKFFLNLAFPALESPMNKKRNLSLRAQRVFAQGHSSAWH
ncbi:hypothetical protein DD237_005257 [Peronospora effusa]|uniref:Uncharacterized protein n=1 Tax=Peronospora effusa TaxID=542832 RepID=A0A3R7WNC6_9STRA|nr:hypothetical protein DD237_005257 [Peronospora effusa]